MTPRYWKYFLNQLRYPEIQRPGPLSLLAEAEGGELDRLYDSGLKLRDQFFPARGEKEGVLIHGKARGIPRHFLENDGQYRLRVLNAWNWQHLAGRHWGLHKIFAEYGFPIITLTNLKDDHWAEFNIDVESPPGIGLGADIWELIYWIVFEYKRASAMLRSLRVMKRARGKINIKMFPVVGERHTVYPPTPVFPQPRTKPILKLAPLSHEKWTVYPRKPLMTTTFARPESVRAGFDLQQRS